MGAEPRGVTQGWCTASLQERRGHWAPAALLRLPRRGGSGMEARGRQGEDPGKPGLDPEALPPWAPDKPTQQVPPKAWGSSMLFLTPASRPMGFSA